MKMRQRLIPNVLRRGLSIAALAFSAFLIPAISQNVPEWSDVYPTTRTNQVYLRLEQAIKEADLSKIEGLAPQIDGFVGEGTAGLYPSPVCSGELVESTKHLRVWPRRRS